MPLVFENEDDYETVRAGDVISTIGLYDMLQNGGKGDVSLKVGRREGQQIIRVRHTISKDQAGFILAGSALNLLAKKKV